MIRLNNVRKMRAIELIQILIAEMNVDFTISIIMMLAEETKLLDYKTKTFILDQLCNNDNRIFDKDKRNGLTEEYKIAVANLLGIRGFKKKDSQIIGQMIMMGGTETARGIFDNYPQKISSLPRCAKRKIRKLLFPSLHEAANIAHILDRYNEKFQISFRGLFTDTSIIKG
ncbi:hypothetical protein JW977_01980 [Candidatus Falkowbacteria bacterium]|nr:hypothetical protein [Candidatus Falkowbacteria bacterium]